MAAITRTKVRISAIYLSKATIFNYVTAEPIEAGQACYINAAGRMAIADAAGPFRGIPLGSGGGGAGISFLKKGHIAGYDLAALDYDDPVYLGAAGELDTAGTVLVGRVVPMPDEPLLTKVLYVLDSDYSEVAA